MHWARQTVQEFSTNTQQKTVDDLCGWKEHCLSLPSFIARGAGWVNTALAPPAKVYVQREGFEAFSD